MFFVPFCLSIGVCVHVIKVMTHCRPRLKAAGCSSCCGWTYLYCLIDLYEYLSCISSTLALRFHTPHSFWTVLHAAFYGLSAVCLNVYNLLQNELWICICRQFQNSWEVMIIFLSSRSVALSRIVEIRKRRCARQSDPYNRLSPNSKPVASSTWES